MAAAVITFEALRKQIQKGDLAPVYLLHGEEGYFLDVLVKDFENVLPEEDREFDESVLYAPQVSPAEVVDACRRFPFMSQRRMVILKECQAARADQINKLSTYVERPSDTAVLVIVFRGANAKGKELLAAAKKNAVIYESKKVKEATIVPMIAAYVKEKNMRIDQKSLEMLRDYIGTDVSRLYNEIDKLCFILGPQATITPEAIERNIGISKEYNNFELVDALAVKDAHKAFSIAAYFASNPKANPLVMTTAALYNFYSDLLVAFYAKDKTDAGLMKDLNLKYPGALRRFRAAMRFYNAYQVIEAIWALRQFDRQSKGLGSRQDPYQLFHDLIFHLLSAPGSLFEYDLP